ncbi:hypothetical protein EC973_009519 [Apophysomyces ossiformis]|uniref:Mitochondrial cardiolipin hydrolase n=1 Tax=Apophysomyces ossiformis TaxID=679940 RepID=A0A8H7END2_9FUNG|nr:hypothetical protein EC973_009519 [Apophysomyces ossiformis]
MSGTLPWDEEERLNLSQLLGQSMLSAETLVSNEDALDKATDHLNLLLKHQKSGQAVGVFDKMFSAAEDAMESDADKHVLSLLKTYVSSMLATSVGAHAFAPKNKHKHSNKEEEEVEQEEKHFSWAEVAATKSSTSDTASNDFPSLGTDGPVTPKPTWTEVAAWHQEKNVDVYYAERAEHRRVQQIHVEYGHREEYISYRGGTHLRGGSFQPRYLDHVPSNIYCMPLFFPSEESYDIFSDALASAQETLYVCVFSLTDNSTARILSDAMNRGVDVRIITDNDQLEGKGADTERLHERYGIPFKTDNSDQFMHNKFAVVDRKHVITGSFNWSIGARFKNRENIIITNIPSVVDSFYKEFERLWDLF